MSTTLLLRPLLDAGTDAKKLVPLLTLLASEPLEQRAPCLGVVASLVRHEKGKCASRRGRHAGRRSRFACLALANEVVATPGTMFIYG